jgi:hypothetical protein
MVVSFRKEGTGLQDFVIMLQNRSQMTKNLAGMKIKVVSSAGYSGYVDQGTRFMSAQPFFETVVTSHSPQEIGIDPTVDKVRKYAQMMANEMKSKAPVDTGYLKDNIQVEG